MNPSPFFIDVTHQAQRNGFPVAEPQNYTAYQGAGFLIPAARTRTIQPPLYAAGITQPRIAAQPVHSVPFTYTIPTADIRTHEPIGMPTPAVGVK
jgi:hypothetical protein